MTRLFVDFDGTITRNDVGDALFAAFGGAAATEAVDAYLAGTISAAECFRRECAACGTPALERIEAFLDAQEIDETFIPFLGWCRAEGIPCTILSDGMEYYIRRILTRCGAPDAALFANTLELVPDGSGVRLAPSFPHADEVCTRCASCKRNHMLRISADDDIIVYAGEGYSDRCPAAFADIVFAKDDLLNYCRREHLACRAYTSFADIQRQLRALRAKGALKPRRRAQLARRELYLGG
jgi:2,3-diketo-5-methylthio-1-phosphopentane phosphatase